MLAKRLDANIIVLHTYSIPVATEFQVPNEILDFEWISKKSGDVQLGQFTTALIERANLMPDSVSQMIEYGEIIFFTLKSSWLLIFLIAIIMKAIIKSHPTWKRCIEAI